MSRSGAEENARERAHGPADHGTAEHGPAETKSSQLRLILLTLLALALQFPGAIVMCLVPGVDDEARIVRIGVAILSPLVFFFVHRWPGPRVAILAGLVMVDVLTWVSNYPPLVYDTGSSEHGDSEGWPWKFGGPHEGGGPGDWNQFFNGPEQAPIYAAFFLALVWAIARGQWIWAAASAGGLWVGALLLGPVMGVEWSVGRVASATIALIVTVAIGALWRRRVVSRRAAQELAARRQDEAAQTERIRIARELHDVLGHSLSQINVQAGVGEHLIDRDPEQARRALAAIKELSSSGLDEVRAVLRTMRSGTENRPSDMTTSPLGAGETRHSEYPLAEADRTGIDDDVPLTPVRGLGDLPELIASMSEGLKVELHDDRADSTMESDVPLSAASDAAGYRIVQEALTNVVRHAGAGTARVELTKDDEFLLIVIRDDGHGLVTGHGLGTGRGLAGGRGSVGGHTEGSGILGMRERTELLGGSFTIDSGDSGTSVTARLPWSARSPRSSTHSNGSPS